MQYIPGIKIRAVYPSHNHVISQIQLPNYLCMIYKRYNPCHVVYVLYNCTISLKVCHIQFTFSSVHVDVFAGFWNMRRDTTDPPREQECSLLHDQNFNVACKTRIRNPSYEVMYCQDKMSLRLSVSISHGYAIIIHIPFIFCLLLIGRFSG